MEKISNTFPVAKIQGETNWGLGTLVGNCILTAAHVIEHAHGMIEVNGTPFMINDGVIVNEKPAENRDVTKNDFAIFKSNVRYNDFEFSTELPKVGDQLTYYTIRNNERIEIDAVVKLIEGNYIKCTTNGDVIEGECGSPIFCGNKLVGILEAGDNQRLEDSRYYGQLGIFQSSVSILKRLKEDYPKFISVY